MVLAVRANLTAQQGSETGPLILVSNRGPIEHYLDEGEHIQRRDAGGGVAVALKQVAEHQPVTWLASSSSFADKVVALAGRRLDLGEFSSLRLLNPPEESYQPFYSLFCNPLLWFVQHSISRDLKRDIHADALTAWRTGYVPVNRLFADAVTEEIRSSQKPARVMFHDYHFYLAPRFVRQAVPDATLQHFVHVPWPGPHTWFALPSCLVRDICTGLLACDSVVFQTEESVDNFMATCRAYLGKDASVREREGTVEYQGLTTSIWSNPISVDVPGLQDLACSPVVNHYQDGLADRTVEKTIVRVDRLDPSKNIVRGFQAYRMLLQRAPDLRKRVQFLAFLVPSRGGIPEYDDYRQQVFQVVDEINEAFGTKDWKPVEVFYEENRSQALAGLRIYDVLLVNSVADGMNLVSKEGPIINERDGALVLSKTAGSCQQLHEGAICIDPNDVSATSEALEKALHLKPAERARRAVDLRFAIERHQLSDWLRHQLKDLAIAQHMRAEASVVSSGSQTDLPGGRATAG